jgi:hypothetical protein
VRLLCSYRKSDRTGLRPSHPQKMAIIPPGRPFSPNSLRLPRAHPRSHARIARGTPDLIAHLSCFISWATSQQPLHVLARSLTYQPVRSWTTPPAAHLSPRGCVRPATDQLARLPASSSHKILHTDHPDPEGNMLGLPFT